MKLLEIGYQRASASMGHKFFDQKTRSGISVNEQPVEELHKPVIKEFTRRKVHARFKSNIWGADLTEMRSLSFKNENVEYFLCVTDVSTKDDKRIKKVKQFPMLLQKQ